MYSRLSAACNSRRSGNDRARAEPSERSVRPALLCLLVFAVAVEGACASAPKTRSFAELHKYIDTGSTIRLVETTGTTGTGTLGTLSATLLTILNSGQSREVPESQVAKIRRPQRRPWQGDRRGRARHGLGSRRGGPDQGRQNRL